MHVYDQCTQNWYAVLSIMEHTLTTVRQTKPEVTEAFFRSDNAGCYHCGFIILSLPSLGQRTGIEVKRYDFSDPQAGKDVCDRRIAAMKSHMRRYINEGHDVQTAYDMKSALDSYGAVKGCYIAVAEISESCQTLTKHSFAGIQAFNNFKFDSTGIRVWKAYDIGPGRLYTNGQLLKMGVAQGATNMKILQDFGNPEQEVGALLNTGKPPESSGREDEGASSDEGHAEDREDVVCFSCPEAGCVKKYASFANLQNHLDTGKHFLKLERESVYDEIKRKWGEACSSVSSCGYVADYQASSSSDQQFSTDTPHACADEGWAVKKTRKSTRFSDKVKLYLRDVFLQGEETGKKASPADISSKLKNLRSEDGKKLFSKEEWLTTQQVASYFSRMSVLNKSGRLRLSDEEVTDGTNEDEAMKEREEMVYEIEIREEIKRHIEL